MIKELQDKTFELAKTLRDNEEFLKSFVESVSKKKVEEVNLIGCTAYIDGMGKEFIDVRLLVDEEETIIRLEF